MTREQGHQATITVMILLKTTLKIVFLHQLCLKGTLAPIVNKEQSNKCPRNDFHKELRNSL